MDTDDPLRRVWFAVHSGAVTRGELAEEAGVDYQTVQRALAEDKDVTHGTAMALGRALASLEGEVTMRSEQINRCIAMAGGDER